MVLNHNVLFYSCGEIIERWGFEWRSDGLDLEIGHYSCYGLLVNINSNLRARKLCKHAYEI